MKKAVFVLLTVIFALSLTIPSMATEEGIWGMVRHYTGHRITLKNGQHYDFSKNVIIGLESLEPDERGNVHIFLDAFGNAEKVLFKGIDMPDVIRRFSR